MDNEKLQRMYRLYFKEITMSESRESARSLTQIDRLANLESPYSPVDASLNGIFLSAMKEADEWHIQRNQAYARLYEAHPQPDIPVSLFKSADLATPVIDEGQWLTSSGTGSGQKTRVFLTLPACCGSRKR